jgi:CHAT domain-containing protein
MALGRLIGLDTKQAGFRAPAIRPDGSYEWPELENTDSETLKIEAEFKRTHKVAKDPKRLDGDRATEEELKKLAANYKYIHLATHGFFARVASDSSSVTDKGFELYSPFVVSKRVRGWDPGLLSGVVMAGANSPHKAGADDGIVTALEVAAMDLQSADLLVLSACETGLGTTAGGEGLLGLQRACQVAGARTVISSLWSVQDLNARSIMERFYVNLWEKKMTKLQALRDAQISALEGALDRGPKGPPVDRSNAPTYRAHPSAWAAWVLSGDWR